MRDNIEPLAQIEGVKGAVLVSRDGLVVASTLESEDEEEVTAAMAASIFGNIDKSLARMDIGSAQDTIIESESHVLQLMGVNELVLVVVTDKTANAGKVRLEMRRCARRLDEMLQSAS